MWPQPITPCQCEAAGFCPRHQCEKSHDWLLLCRLNWQMFERWERGEGPCFDRIRAEQNRLAPPSQPFGELPACRHRGAEPLEHANCELCGGRTEQVPIFACTLLGKCTTRRYGSRTEIMRTMPSCVRCEKYEAVENALAETAVNELEAQTRAGPPGG
jgi:hypothetical protein